MQALNNIYSLNNIIIIGMGSQLCPTSQSDLSSSEDIDPVELANVEHYRKDQRISCRSTQIPPSYQKYIEPQFSHIPEALLPGQRSPVGHQPIVETEMPQVKESKELPQKKQSQFQLPDKTVFKGTTINDIPNGYGEQNHSNGEVYKGDFKNGEKHGLGCYKFSNSEQYEGEFKHNMMHGKGIYLFDNGDRYIGDFTNNLRHGIGRYILKQPNSLKIEYFEGAYRENERNGEGFVRYTTGDFFKGLWKNGLLLRAI